MCLQETKLSLINQQLASEILGHNLDGYCYLPANGTKGGILVGWQTDHVEATNYVLNDFSYQWKSSLNRPAWVSCSPQSMDLP
jgi:hypothetical protein